VFSFFFFLLLSTIPSIQKPLLHAIYKPSTQHNLPIINQKSNKNFPPKNFKNKKNNLVLQPKMEKNKKHGKNNVFIFSPPPLLLPS